MAMKFCHSPQPLLFVPSLLEVTGSHCFNRSIKNSLGRRTAVSTHVIHRVKQRVDCSFSPNMTWPLAIIFNGTFWCYQFTLLSYFGCNAAEAKQKQQKRLENTSCSFIVSLSFKVKWMDTWQSYIWDACYSCILLQNRAYGAYEAFLSNILEKAGVLLCSTELWILRAGQRWYSQQKRSKLSPPGRPAVNQW